MGCLMQQVRESWSLRNRCTSTGVCRRWRALASRVDCCRRTTGWCMVGPQQHTSPPSCFTSFSSPSPLLLLLSALPPDPSPPLPPPPPPAPLQTRDSSVLCFLLLVCMIPYIMYLSPCYHQVFTGTLFVIIPTNRCDDVRGWEPVWRCGGADELWWQGAGEAWRSLISVGRHRPGVAQRGLRSPKRRGWRRRRLAACIGSTGRQPRGHSWQNSAHSCN